MKPKSFNHIHLEVENLEESVRFYCDNFGFKEHRRFDGLVFLRLGDMDFAICEGRPVKDENFHFGFRVNTEKEVEKWHSFLQDRGVRVQPVQKHDSHTAFRMKDPSGYKIEFYFEPGT
ncbi:MAG: VOC family protein [candidate division Zixibacteria bacterium]|nr:VOC family protein [candidate division Zixibacteria bacterium]